MKNNTKEVLVPSHKLWPLFRKKLEDTLFTYTNNKIHNRCNGDLTITIEILKSMESIDIKETVILFKELGGSCDCKISANVARIWNNR
jgi:hypothetical protein